jgi:type IV pilus assembly protein PilB
MKRKKLGEILEERGKISASDLQQLFKEQEGKMIRLGELILERDLVDKASLVKALEDVSRVPYLDCTEIQCEKAVLHLIPKPIALRLTVLPIRLEEPRIVVAMAEPQNVAIIDELRFTTGKELSPYFGFRAEILAGIGRNYEACEDNAALGQVGASTEESLEGHGREIEFISTSSRQANREAIQEIQLELIQKKTPAVRLVSKIIQRAMEKQASDIHIEPQANATLVRIRVDGVLRELENVPRSIQNSLVSRIKILSDMDIGERRTPQDGRFMVAVGKHRVDMRVSTLPTQYGEKVVMRLLEASAPIVSFLDLGFPQETADRLSQMIAQPQGMVLVTGPTGSGKSTTLYSALNLLRRPAVNIVTVEDPVEYVLEGINQVHVNSRAGLTFASCLRSILRQDPNVIMIGEIRDLETAEIALKAAQTGHLVLSTLHTNDSISALVRLLDLGIAEFLIASSMTGILAQRLLRKLCECHSYREVTGEYAERLEAIGVMQPPDRIAWPEGCNLCDHTGYRGRVGIYELLPIDESIRSILRSNFKLDLVRSAARASGMRRMQDDALEKLQAGITTLEEVLRVVPIEAITSARCEQCDHDLLPAFRFCPHCGTRRAPEDPESNTKPSVIITDRVLSS